MLMSLHSPVLPLLLLSPHLYFPDPNPARMQAGTEPRRCGRMTLHAHIIMLPLLPPPQPFFCQDASWHRVDALWEGVALMSRLVGNVAGCSNSVEKYRCVGGA